MERKRILVTGGAGFIGSHLCRRLHEMGHEVVCMDNFFTGTMENIAPLMESPRFSLIEHTVEEPYQISVDEIYNLACPASPIHYQYDPIQTFKTSVLGAMHMLGVAKACGAKMLHASTSEVYGDPEFHPQREEYWGHVNPLGIRACYDEGKRGAETLCIDYHRRHGVRVKIIRIFNTYGPNMLPDDGRVVSNFIVQALKGEDVTIYGSGEQTRSFQYIDNLIDGMIAVMGTDDSITGPVNLGNPNEMSILELAQRIIELTGSRSHIVFRELPQDDPRQRRPDISLARRLIGYQPDIDLNEGLSRTIEYFRERLLSPVETKNNRYGK